jgi:hypothetical protein
VPFLIRGLDPKPFVPLFDLSSEALAAKGVQRTRADQSDAYPCRVALERVHEGEELLLLHHVHLPVESSPYRSGGPIFVSRSATQGTFEDELPPILRDRLLSLRAYDERAFMIDAEVAEGPSVETILNAFLRNPAVAQVDIHFARRGCFAARARRL